MSSFSATIDAASDEKDAAEEDAEYEREREATRKEWERRVG
jgi:hypothetical protein